MCLFVCLCGVMRGLIVWYMSAKQEVYQKDAMIKKKKDAVNPERVAHQL